MKRSGRKLIIIGLIAAVFLVGCYNEPAAVGNSTEHEQQSYQIGLSFDSFVIERWLRDRDAFVTTAEELGAEVNVQNANGSLTEQISQIEYFINKKMDVIVIVAVDCSGLGTAIEKAQKEGIKVISYDRLIQDVRTDLYISFDNEQVGEEMAASIVEQLPEGGNIACIMGPESDNNVFMVQQGFERIIAENPGVNIAYTQHCENWDADLAPQYAEEAIAQVENLAAIMCGNDDIATQVSKTLAEYRLAGNVVVVGQDADLAACQRIVEGTQTMTVFKHVEELAKIAANFAVELAKEEDISDSTGSLDYYTTDQINNGQYNIPYYRLEPVVVTAENMDQVIIDSGFHEAGEVYLNVEFEK
ncbi:MAG: sugar ABC transporter substrate-binding protein [Lachnospiraceae bacterium]